MDQFVCDNCSRRFKNINALRTHKAHESGKHPGWKHINEDENRRSYPEKFLLNVFAKNDIFSKFTIKEKMSYSKYFLDFAIIELKLCIEVDGVQHIRDEESIKHDKVRDLFLESNGWKVYRINWIEMCSNTESEIDSLIKYISNIDGQQSRYYSIEDVMKKKRIRKSREDIEKEKTIKYEKSQNKYVDLILGSDIDFTKYGWVNEVAFLIDRSPQKVNQWMKRFMPKTFDKAFKRKTRNMSS